MHIWHHGPKRFALEANTQIPGLHVFPQFGKFSFRRQRKIAGMGQDFQTSPAGFVMSVPNDGILRWNGVPLPCRERLLQHHKYARPSIPLTVGFTDF
jgi:hypothetical protein